MANPFGSGGEWNAPQFSGTGFSGTGPGNWQAAALAAGWAPSWSGGFWPGTFPSSAAPWAPQQEMSGTGWGHPWGGGWQGQGGFGHMGFGQAGMGQGPMMAHWHPSMGMGMGMAPGMGMGMGQGFGPHMWQPGQMGWQHPGIGAGGFTMNDDDLKQMVYDSLDNDPSIPYDMDINVDCSNGVVTLTGTVPHKRIKHAAGDAAWWLPGVTDVENQLEVAERRKRRTQPGRGAQGGTPRQQARG